MGQRHVNIHVTRPTTGPKDWQRIRSIFDQRPMVMCFMSHFCIAYSVNEYLNVALED